MSEKTEYSFEKKNKANIDAIKVIAEALPDAGALTSIAQEDNVETHVGASLAAYNTTGVATEAVNIQSRDILYGNDGSGTITFAGAGAQTKVIKSYSTRSKIHDIILDMNNITCDTVTVDIQVKIDGANYRTVDSFVWISTDSKGFYCGSITTQQYVQLVITPSATQQTLTIPYTFVVEYMQVV